MKEIPIFQYFSRLKFWNFSSENSNLSTFFYNSVATTTPNETPKRISMISKHQYTNCKTSSKKKNITFTLSRGPQWFQTQLISLFGQLLMKAVRTIHSTKRIGCLIELLKGQSRSYIWRKIFVNRKIWFGYKRGSYPSPFFFTSWSIFYKKFQTQLPNDESNQWIDDKNVQTSTIYRSSTHNFLNLASHFTNSFPFPKNDVKNFRTRHLYFFSIPLREFGKNVQKFQPISWYRSITIEK